MNRGELGKAIGAISKVHGSSVITPASLRPRLRHIPTGIFTLDMALLGGIPEGAISLFYGWQHSGKTTVALRALARAQAKYPDKIPVLLDLEGTYAPEWGAIHGIDNERLGYVQPDTGEQAMDVINELMKSEETSMIVVDSLAALVPFKEIDKSFEDALVGEQARLISRFCRVAQNTLLTQRKRGHRPSVILVNQWRYKIGTMYGDPRTLPGGQAQHYAATVKVEFKNKEKEGVGEADTKTVLYNDHSFSLDKNKVGTAVREGEFRMVRDPAHPLGQGFIDDAATVTTWARALGLVTGDGSSAKRIQGVDQEFRRLQDVADYFYENPEFYEQFKIDLIRDYRESAGLDPEFL